MELSKIEVFLEKYFDGDSNEEEELALRNYFAQENIAKHLIQYQALFGYFAEAKQIKNKKEFMLKSAEHPKKNRAFLLSIAATLIVGLGVVIFMYTSYQPENESDLGTYNDPKVALEETQKALTLLSKHVNTGYESVQYIGEYEVTKNKIFNVN
ncbi:hypothetical protein FLAN108750_01740 [Flavobacterium antarcticum]|uniref:hypothetical protein n=1 Tax=Flavobacterium antarcticum TaxID=271155 RepID=UPI0003FB3201|nr:hypothetical protein [Flavobacterium antarcticum]